MNCDICKQAIPSEEQEGVLYTDLPIHINQARYLSLCAKCFGLIKDTILASRHPKYSDYKKAPFIALTHCIELLRVRLDERDAIREGKNRDT